MKKLTCAIMALTAVEVVRTVQSTIALRQQRKALSIRDDIEKRIEDAMSALEDSIYEPRAPEWLESLSEMIRGDGGGTGVNPERPKSVL